MRPQLTITLFAVLAALALPACAQTSGSTSPANLSTTVSGRAAPGTTTTASSARPARRPAKRPAVHKPAPARGGLAVSRASGEVVQTQPAPGSCHARGSGAYAQPDPSCTPGALNPSVTQASIASTICVPGWTRTVRPQAAVTDVEKGTSMAAYGDTGSEGAYEYDHLVPLELGGAVNDARNLWSEPGGSPNPKDSVENALHRMVCAGQMQLARAQHIITADWVSWAKSHGHGNTVTPSRAPTHTSSSSHPGTAPASGPNKPISEVNCSDFPTHVAAQQWFEGHGGSSSNDVAGLDHDHDGLACESLP